MNYAEIYLKFVFFVCVCVLLYFVVFSAIEKSRIIDACEANLPRTQHCKLVAVPEIVVMK